MMRKKHLKYLEAVYLISSNSENDILNAIKILKELDDYLESRDLLEGFQKKYDILIEERKIEETRIQQEKLEKEKERINKAINDLSSDDVSLLQKSVSYLNDKTDLTKEVIEKIELAKQKILESKNQKKKRNKLYISLAAVACILTIIAFTIITFVIPQNKYNEAILLMNDQKYDEAYNIFLELGDYKDSSEKINTILTKKYDQATLLMNDKKYDEAYKIFLELGDYKDSSEKINTILAKKEAKKLKGYKVGDSIKFGTYEQDGNENNGKETIWWRILDIKDGKYFVVSKYALYITVYGGGDMWIDSHGREELNNEFYNSSFSDIEKKLITTTLVSTTNEPSTNDKLFWLSVDEVNKYFANNDDRKCILSGYERYWSGSSGECTWYLRTPGTDPYSLYTSDACAVYETGEVLNHVAKASTFLYIASRPAMWIDLAE